MTALLVLELVFVVVALGLRTAVQLRRTGETGWVLPRRSDPFAKRAGVLMIVTCSPLFGVAPFLDAWGTSDAVGWIGFGLAVAGIKLCFFAQLNMRDSWRIGVDPELRTELVTDGLFGWVRNPIYTAVLIAALGFVLLVPNAVSVAAFALLVVGIEMLVRLVEEPYLANVHGIAFSAYRSRVGRFIPGIGRNSSPAARVVHGD